MEDRSRDEARAERVDRALREALTSIGPPARAPHTLRDRRDAIYTAIRVGWSQGGPPTADDLAREPHPVDRWDGVGFGARAAARDHDDEPDPGR